VKKLKLYTTISRKLKELGFTTHLSKDPFEPVYRLIFRDNDLFEKVKEVFKDTFPEEDEESILALSSISSTGDVTSYDGKILFDIPIPLLSHYEYKDSELFTIPPSPIPKCEISKLEVHKLGWQTILRVHLVCSENLTESDIEKITKYIQLLEKLGKEIIEKTSSH